ncbi:hypothetical protein, variant [Saprolegnia diclina VS20]|uniref:FYVE-type domain-containing protein n=1 Tax=Saprolegnia diclina (strain VS20) TaxID=1156394 RepID=T0PPX7_SAPDV|nr:hypothetical protein, variant [Saprolegnia diclina VS20]EQC27499.1 hypothetical protein, variant [Saprolegnia diclina VS20]|eukprot:XP_008619073.1 hypothetical protein, variant [Saprolegnia diclina VS20]
MVSSKFPVPDEFFLSPTLPVEEKRYLTHIARTACKELIKNARMNGDTVQWHPIGRPDSGSASHIITDGLPAAAEIHSMMYEGRSKRDTWINNHKNNIIMGSCVTQVAGTIEEVAAFYQRSTTAEARSMAASYEEDFLDTFVLHTLTPPTPENPWHNITVRWTATKSPWSVAKHRDLCYVECQDEFVDVSGRRGWVLARESVSLPICPPLSGMHLVRATTERSGMVFLESETTGLLNVIQMSMIDFKGSLPRLMSRVAIRRRLAEVLHLNRFLHERRLSHEPILGDLDLIPKAERVFCNVCNKKFGVFTRHKVRCRKCGEVVCMACQNVWTVDIAVRHTVHNYKQLPPRARRNVRICVPCSRETRVRSLTMAATTTMNTSMDTMQALNIYGGVPAHGGTMRESDDLLSDDMLQSARSKATTSYEYPARPSTLLYNIPSTHNEDRDDDEDDRLSLTDDNYRRSKSLEVHQTHYEYTGVYDDDDDDALEADDEWNPALEHLAPREFAANNERLSMISAADSLSQSFVSSMDSVSHMGSYRDSTPLFNYRAVDVDAARATRRGSIPYNSSISFGYELKQPLYQAQTTQQVIEQLVTSARQLDEHRRSSVTGRTSRTSSRESGRISGRESGQTFQFCDNKLVGIRSSEMKKTPVVFDPTSKPATSWRDSKPSTLFASFNSNHTDSEKTPVHSRGSADLDFVLEGDADDENKKVRVTELRERMQVMTQDVLRGSGRLPSQASMGHESDVGPEDLVALYKELKAMRM